jgi:hypothetical protein
MIEIAERLSSIKSDAMGWSSFPGAEQRLV